MHRIIYWERASWPDRLEASLHKVPSVKLYVAIKHFEQLGLRTLDARASIVLSSDTRSGMWMAWPWQDMPYDWVHYVIRVNTRTKESQYHGWFVGKQFNAAELEFWPPNQKVYQRRVLWSWEFNDGVPRDRGEVEEAAEGRRKRVFGGGDGEASRAGRGGDACEVRQRRLFDP